MTTNRFYNVHRKRLNFKRDIKKTTNDQKRPQNYKEIRITTQRGKTTTERHKMAIKRLKTTKKREKLPKGEAKCPQIDTTSL